jgi:hypothetical protein
MRFTTTFCFSFHFSSFTISIGKITPMLRLPCLVNFLTFLFLSIYLIYFPPEADKCYAACCVITPDYIFILLQNPIFFKKKNAISGGFGLVFIGFMPRMSPRRIRCSSRFADCIRLSGRPRPKSRRRKRDCRQFGIASFWNRLL